MTTLKEIWRFNAIPIHINMSDSGMMSMQLWAHMVCTRMRNSKFKQTGE